MPQTQTRCGSSLIKVIWYRLDCRWYGRCQTSFSSSISPQPNREASHCLANHHDLTPGVVMRSTDARALLVPAVSLTPQALGYKHNGYSTAVFTSTGMGKLYHNDSTGTLHKYRYYRTGKHQGNDDLCFATNSCIVLAPEMSAQTTASKMSRSSRHHTWRVSLFPSKSAPNSEQVPSIVNSVYCTRMVRWITNNLF